MTNKNAATFFQEEVYRLARSPRYAKHLTVYQTIGALELVKDNLITDLKRSNAAEQKDEDEQNFWPDGTKRE